ncbi:MAG TPA: arginine deiminase-related protein [Parafilimonas sp.]|nr:arginine deiminase-related protein [Parafilimonas sp.]
MQNTSNVLMIRPVHFTYNAETAANNLFQVAGSAEGAQDKALKEFDEFIEKLRQNNINVSVINDTPEPHTPDSIFPNNWISFHENGTVVLYPMYAESRRAERKQHVKDIINQNFSINNIIDLTRFENDDLFLEGTGSMVLDRDERIAYACISPRTNVEVLTDFCNKMNYTPCVFEAHDATGHQVYHTNVMMCVADKYVVICLDSITKTEERQNVEDSITASGKGIVPISLDQMNKFAGNMLQLENKGGQKILVMSTQAYESLSEEQKQKLSAYNQVLHSDLRTIETNGGGSARCMIAEVFLPAKR